MASFCTPPLPTPFSNPNHLLPTPFSNPNHLVPPPPPRTKIFRLSQNRRKTSHRHDAIRSHPKTRTSPNRPTTQTGDGARGSSTQARSHSFERGSGSRAGEIGPGITPSRTIATTGGIIATSVGNVAGGFGG